MLVISPEIQGTLQRGSPVVALESTIISHGMPYPQNLETAHAVEGLVRAQGAIPATIAVIDGHIKIGLSYEELEIVASGAAKRVFHKLTTADLPYAMTNKSCGSTTVAATIFCAQMAGIKVMATGGIGGAHRGCELSFDISADLNQLTKAAVVVVCSGVKSVLDIGKTLELLETLQVPVIGYQTLEMPAFYSQHSGHFLTMKLDSPAAIANFVSYQRTIGLKNATLITLAPPEEFALDFDKMEATIELSLEAARKQNISGQAVTPFLLSAIEKLTGGKSLAVNQALIKNNATLAAQIAVCLAQKPDH